MGALCCCLSSDSSFDDYRPYPSSAFLRSCLPWLFNSHYSSNFDEVEQQEPRFPNHVAPSGSGGDGDGAMPVVFQAPPAPLPYDADLRHLRTPPSRRDKSGMSQEPLRHGDSDGGGDSTALQRRFGNEDLKPPPPSKPFPRVESVLSMLDDDDFCPTCLDGYTEENPKITTACGHNYHLSCIYEWMERSDRCPVCDKEMKFSESV